MARVSFTQNLQRHLAAAETDAPGATVRQVLEAVFAANPPLRTYLLDDQGAVRRHVVIFVDGTPVADRVNLSDSVQPGSELYVMQALSGG